MRACHRVAPTAEVDFLSSPAVRRRLLVSVQIAQVGVAQSRCTRAGTRSAGSRPGPPHASAAPTIRRREARKASQPWYRSARFGGGYEERWPYFREGCEAIPWTLDLAVGGPDAMR